MPAARRRRVEIRPVYRLRVSTRHLAPVAELWARKTDPAAVMQEFPVWAPFRINRPDAISAAVAEGAPRLRVPARVGPVPWESTVWVVEPGRSFANVGTSALFTLFHHTQSLQETGNGTHVLDDIWFTPTRGGDFFAGMVTRVFVARHRRAAEAIPADSHSIGHAVLRHVLEDETFEPDRFVAPA